MSYVDGFLLIVPKKNIKGYTALAKKAGKVWMDNGAVQYVECAADDLKTQMGVPFAKRAGAKKTDVIFFSWIVYKSRKHRDQVNKKVMKDPRMLKMMKDTPANLFDCTQMSYGGFKPVVKM